MSRFDRREFLVGAAASVAAPKAGVAQTPWPQAHTIKIIVPFTPGGATDIIARIVGDRLARLWNTTVIVENRAGAGANIGADVVAHAEPNGDTIMMTAPFMALNKFLYKTLTWDPDADFTHVSLVALVPNMLVAGNHLKIATVADLIAYGKANQGELMFASSGVGTSIHLAGELFKSMTGIEMIHVPYRGSAPAIQDIIGGKVDVMFDNITSSLEQVRSGQLRGIAITTAKRSKLAPDLPPIADTIPGYDVSSWFGFSLPRKTDNSIIARLASDTRTAIADPEVRAKLEGLAAEPIGSTPVEFASFIKKESETWGKLIRDNSISAE